MKFKFTLLLLALSISFASAQSSWKKIDSESYHAKSDLAFRKNQPKKFDLYDLDIKNFKSDLNQIKLGKNIIQLPNNDGELSQYKIIESTNFTQPVSKEYGFLKSYSLKGIDDKTATGKISFGTDGVHITIFSAKHSTQYIDPYTKDKLTYVSYNRKDIPSQNSDFDCLFDENSVKQEIKNATSQRNADDGKLRTFRLALACTGEYAQFHLNNQGVPTNATDAVKKAAVLSAMNTTMTRVNGVYERELSVRMNIVVNTSGENELIFLDPNTDNLTNNSASVLINESQNVCDNIIGAANYDIGHTFSTGAGGLAGLGVVCTNGQKGRGITGTNSPIGDPYDIDFVAHEIGHQFGAPHTFNNSCGGNRSNANAVEPGSGSTIMAYAGICSPNVQNNSDDYFHAVSITSMWNTIQSSATCGAETDTGNSAPTANAGTDVTVPKSTPLVLRGEATDADGLNGLTYCWEQIDTEIATMPPLSTNTGGPAFRSLSPSDSTDRYLPALPTVIAGNTSSTWEVIPSVAREMNFALVVRDNHAGGASSARDDMTITVADVEPFLITSHNDGSSWDVGVTQTITWDKSTTDLAPINCQNVRIKLSIDGGVTFPIVLVESTPNDGSHDLAMSNHPTSQARIMVEAVGNIFYNVNSTNFTINLTDPTFFIENTTAEQSVCNNTNNDVDFVFDLDFVNGFTETVSFSADNLPAGATVSFSPTTINTNGTVTMTVSNLNGVTAQDHTITVNANSSTVSRTSEAQLVVLGDTFTSPTLTDPANNSTDVSIVPQLTWNAVSGATSYDVEIASDEAFNSIIISDNTSTNSYILTIPLESSSLFYWRVKPKNDCGEGDFSTPFSFTTEGPSYCASTFTESVGSEYISNVTFNTINNDSGDDHIPTADDGYQDFTNISTTVQPGDTHQVSVTYDAVGFQDHCYVFIDWNQDYVFNTTDERYDLGTLAGDLVTATMDITIPNDAANGETRMRIVMEYDDPTNGYGEGPCASDHLTGWGETEDYTVVVDNPASIEDFAFNSFSLYPNPSSGGVFKLRFEVVDTNKVSINLFDLAGREMGEKVYTNTSSIFSEELTFDQLSTGIYLLQIKNGNKQTTKKLVIK
jgi:hypothetical protein